MRHFHSYGPVDPQRHFTVPRAELVARCVEQLVDDPDTGGHYFTLWAPRQTGKTWLMHRAVEEVRARHGDRFLVGTLSMQDIEFEGKGSSKAFLRQVPQLFRDWFGIEIPTPTTWRDWALLFKRGSSPFDRPLILLIDEFDRLPPLLIDKLVSSFRALYLNRAVSLLHGLALVGVRAVLGVDSPRGSPFNVQRSFHVPNFTADEVVELFQQYQVESGRPIAPEVVRRVYEVTSGQPGLIGWFGELLTERYLPVDGGPITLPLWEAVYDRACTIEPNNTILNLLKKAQAERYREHVVALFRTSNIPFNFDDEWCNYLYLHGVIAYEEIQGPADQRLAVCRFSSPLVQRRLYHAFSREMAELGGRVPAVDPRLDLTDAFARLDPVALLNAYRDYLQRLKARGINPWQGHPRRADLHVREAVGHFHLYWWLLEASGLAVLVTPEFPTGNGKVDLHLRRGAQTAVIEVKSFTQRRDLPTQKEQAARYARSQGLPAATLALFVPTDDEPLVAELCAAEILTVDGQPVQVSTVAIAAA